MCVSRSNGMLFAIVGSLIAGECAASAQSKPSGGVDPGFGGEPDPNTLVVPELVISHSPIAIGDAELEMVLALRLEIADGWHVYWRNSGDTGAPPSWSFELPAGVSLGEPLWPTPERYHPSPNATDFIFEDELVVLFPIEIEDGAREAMASAGAGELAFRADLNWLVCRDECLAGEGQVQTSAPFVSTASAVRPRAELFDKWLGRVPSDEPADLDQSGVVAEFEDDVLMVHVPDAVELVWYHDAYEAYFEPVDSTLDGLAQGNSLRVRYTAAPDSVTEILGVLRAGYALPNGDLEYRSFELRVPVE